MLSGLPRMKFHVLTQLVYVVLDWFPETLAGVSPAEDGLEVNVKEGDFSSLPCWDAFGVLAGGLIVRA